MFKRIFILAMLMLSAVSGCGLLDDRVPCDDWLFTDMMLTPPPDAVVLREECRMGIQPLHTIVFTLPADQLTGFQDSTLITEWRSDDTSRAESRFADDVRGASSVFTGRYIDGVYLIDALIDASDADSYMVYYAIAFID